MRDISKILIPLLGSSVCVRGHEMTLSRDAIPGSRIDREVIIPQSVVAVGYMFDDNSYSDELYFRSYPHRGRILWRSGPPPARPPDQPVVPPESRLWIYADWSVSAGERGGKEVAGWFYPPAEILEMHASLWADATRKEADAWLLEFARKAIERYRDYRSNPCYGAGVEIWERTYEGCQCTTMHYEYSLTSLDDAAAAIRKNFGWHRECRFTD